MHLGNSTLGPGYHTARRICHLGTLLGLIALWMAGCLYPARPTPQPSPTATQTAAPMTSTPVMGTTPTPLVSVSPSVTSTTVITLTIWTTPIFAPGQTSPAARVLAEQARAFAHAYPDYRLEWVVKPPAGPGGVLDFMRAAQGVAPAILPDLAILDSCELGHAVRTGLLQPIDALIPEETRSDLFPFARNASLVEGQWYGILFGAELEHLIYNTTLIEAPPLTWADVLSDSVTYAFPAGGENGRVNDIFLTQYLALGGRLSDEKNKPILDEAPLTSVLSFYANGMRAGAFPQTVIELKSSEEVLPLYVNGQAAMCAIRSDLYLGHRDKLRNTSFASIPTWNGTVATMGRGSILVLIASDSTRQAAAKAFVNWFLDPERQAAWTRAAGRLPTRMAVLSLWDIKDDYTSFIRWQLAAAYYAPSAPEFDHLYGVLQQAVREVLTGSASPEEAARQAVAAVAGQR